MTRFTFQGTGQTADSLPVKPVLVLVAGVAVAAWLATILWILAVAGIVILTVSAAGVIVLRRGSDRDAEVITARLAEFHAAEKARLAAPQPPMIVNHYHGGVHVHGTDAAGIIRQAPIEGAVIEEG